MIEPVPDDVMLRPGGKNTANKKETKEGEKNSVESPETLW